MKHIEEICCRVVACACADHHLRGAAIGHIWVVHNILQCECICKSREHACDALQGVLVGKSQGPAGIVDCIDRMTDAGNGKSRLSPLSDAVVVAMCGDTHTAVGVQGPTMRTGNHSREPLPWCIEGYHSSNVLLPGLLA